MAETILIVDFGSQYTQLIARRVRELNVYCEIHPYHHLSAAPAADQIKGVILSGSPCSVIDPRRSDHRPWLSFMGRVPVLGICYGAQLMAHTHGGEVVPSRIREYGRARLSRVDTHVGLLKELTP